MTNPEHHDEDRTDPPSSLPTETETKQLGPLDEILNLMIKEKFRGATSWTARGKPETLQAKTEEQLREALDRDPNEVVLTLKKLSDGGFEIRTFSK